VSEIRIVRDYPHSAAKLWRALTDPALVPLWTSLNARVLRVLWLIGPSASVSGRLVTLQSFINI
jgi:hypothetical protein